MDLVREPPFFGAGAEREFKNVAGIRCLLHRAIRQRLFHRGEPHMHHFTRASLHALIAAAGFSGDSETVISERFGVLAIEARKAG